METDTNEPGAKDKAGKTEVLLIGDKVRDKDQYFARLAGDNSVVRVSSKQLEPIFALIKDPKPLRSHDVSLIEPDTIDAVEVIRGKEFAKLFKQGDGWRVFPSDESPRKANPSTITGPTGLLSAIKGSHEIKDKDFVEADTAEKKKELEAKFAPNIIEAKAIAWADSLAPKVEKKDEKKDEKKEEKKDDKALEKKDEKKEDKKEEKKDQVKDDKKIDPKADKKEEAKGDKKIEPASDKKDADKKEEAKDDKAQPEFKKDAKAAVTLSFVKVDKEKVLVKREAPDIEPVYFHLATTAFQKIVPPDMALAFFDNSVNTFSPFDAIKLELSRAPTKDRDKLMETFVLAKGSQEKEKEKVKGKEADKDKASEKGKDKDKDKEPAKDAAKSKDKDAESKSDWKLIEPKGFAGKGEIDTGEIENVLVTLANLKAVRWVQKVSKDTLSHYGLDDKHWTVRVAVTFKKQESDKEEPKPFVLRLGDGSNKDTDKGAVFALLEGTDYVFLVDNRLEKMLKEAEFRDRHVLKFDPSKVKELRVFVATSDKEIRKPVFERDADKTWKDKKDSLGFKVDSRKVDTLLDTLADLQAVRYVSVKGAAPKDYELGDAAPLKFEIVMDDGKTVHTVTVGAASEKNGPYYAQSDALAGGVFLVSKDPFSELMGKVTYFRKD